MSNANARREQSLADSICILIAEGDRSTRKSVLRAVNREAGWEVVDTCETLTQLKRSVHESNPDLILVDAGLLRAIDFKLLEALDVDPLPEIIVIADNGQYAVQAFDLGATDYLVRPVTDSRLTVALHRVRSHGRFGSDSTRHGPIQIVTQQHEVGGQLTSEFEEAGQKASYVQRIMVKSSTGLHFVDTADINWIEACGDHLILHLDKGKYTIRGTMKAIEQKLDPRRFVRTHRSSIVNLRELEQLQPYFRGEYVAVLRDGTKLRLSRGRKKILEYLIGQPF